MLYAATFNNHLDLVDTLILNAKINVNAAAINGHTALYVACEKGYDSIVNALLKNKKIDVNKSIKDGTSPLAISIFNGHSSIALMLIKNKKTDVNSKSTTDNFTPLHYAAFKEDEEIVAALIRRGAEVNAKTKKGYQPIIGAVYNNRLGVVKILLNNGADIPFKKLTDAKKISAEMLVLLNSHKKPQ
jgi:ankyrin repeat protein